MVTIVKCNCGDAICNRYGLSDGVFYQGNGWEKKRAQQYADAINEYDMLRLQELENRLQDEDQAGGGE